MSIDNTESSSDRLQHLKQVSRIKHMILSGYFPVWQVILAARHETLNYIDCFAGPGRYEFAGNEVDGSPVIATRAAIEFAKRHPDRKANLVFVEENEHQESELSAAIQRLGDMPSNISVKVKPENTHTYIPELLQTNLGQEGAPAFFLIDPYGHPLSVPIINKILERPRSEVLINLMWYRINMDMANPLVQANVTSMLGDDQWTAQRFVEQSGIEREKGFVDYFCSRLRARYILPFRIKFDLEDMVYGDRTKYYLLHASNHPKAALLMKEVMWPLGDEEGTFDYSGTSQGVLISQTPREDELAEILRLRYAGATISFEGIRADTWKLPFIEKHYRSVLLSLEERGQVRIKRISSKRSGLKGSDQISFLVVSEELQ